MDLHELFFETLPAVKSIFELGFIPEEDEIHELSPELYAMYEKKGGDVSKRLYTIVPKDGTNFVPGNEISLLTEDTLPNLWKGVAIIRKHAKRAGCESSDSDELLAAAATVIPSVFSEGTRFEQVKR